MIRLAFIFAILIVGAGLWTLAAGAQEAKTGEPSTPSAPGPQDPQAPKHTASAIVAGGCFWCVESDLDALPGVLKTVSGYTGGTIDHPTYGNYHDAGPGIVPHVEAVEVTFDTDRLSYADLLRYFTRHTDVLDGGGQFCDRGPSYRPVIFTNGPGEEKTAREVLAEAEKTLGRKVAVEVLPAAKFWPAEDYHQDYHDKNPVQYKFYRWNCGRDQRVEQLWGKQPPAAH